LKGGKKKKRQKPLLGKKKRRVLSILAEEKRGRGWTVLNEKNTFSLEKKGLAYLPVSNEGKREGL